MNYIGSKFSLLGEIETVLAAHQVPTSGRALDVFAGTGAVAQLLKQRGHATYANDWQYYSYLTTYAYLAFNSFPRFETLLNDRMWGAEVRRSPHSAPIFTFSNEQRDLLNLDIPCALILTYLNNLPGADGSFFETYCEDGHAGRMYFSRDNGRRIQAIRTLIQSWFADQLITESEHHWLVACLLESADRVANTASVYGAYLKHVKKSAQKPLTLMALRPTPSTLPTNEHQVFCEDSTLLVKQLRDTFFELVYADPPYNQRHYSSNYHILETIAQWDLDTFEPRGITGLRNSEVQKSDFCVRSKVADALHDLLEHINCNYFLLSYNNEGLLTEEELETAFREHFETYSITKIPFKRFRADVDHDNRLYKTDTTDEFLVMGQTKRQLHLALPPREMMLPAR